MRSFYVTRLVEESFHLSEKFQRVRQGGVGVERGFIHPARVDVKKPRVADRAKSVKVQASGFLAGMDNHISQRLPESIFAPERA